MADLVQTKSNKVNESHSLNGSLVKTIDSAERVTHYDDIITLQKIAGNQSVSDLFCNLNSSPSQDKTSQSHSQAGMHYVLDGVSGKGQSLPYLNQIQRSFGRHDLSSVRSHHDTSAKNANTRMDSSAYTFGNHIAFRNRPSLRTAAHEAAHVIQQRQGGFNGMQSGDSHERNAVEVANLVAEGQSSEAMLRQGSVFSPSVQREKLIPITVYGPRLSYTPVGSNKEYRVGDVLASNLLMKIEDNPQKGIVFHWYNFHDGQAISGTWRDWSIKHLGARFVTTTTQKYIALAKQLTPKQLMQLWPNPVPHIMKMFEENKLNINEDVVKDIYRGMIVKESLERLNENEKIIDGLLADKGRKKRLEEYAKGLKEASYVRDQLLKRKGVVERRLSLSQQQFHLGLPKRQLMAGVNGPARFRVIHEQAELEQALDFWTSAFPLLTRLKTQEINAGRVFEVLKTIKENIVSTRSEIIGRKSSLDPWELSNVRASISSKLGPKTKKVVKEEDESRRNWAWFKTGLSIAIGIGLLFVPGGIFIDLAIGVAIAAKSWSDAKTIGRAANTGLHVDDGLMAQADANSAKFSAMLATIFTVLGAAAASLRILRVTRAFRSISRAAPTLSMSSRLRLARIFANKPQIISNLASRISKDKTVIQNIKEALSVYSRNSFRMRQALEAISEGYKGSVRRAWTHGLHPDAITALKNANDIELEVIEKLVRNNPGSAQDILRQFTYGAQKAGRKAGGKFKPPADVAARLTQSIDLLKQVTKRGYPYGFKSVSHFRRFSNTIKDALKKYGVNPKDVRVHGSSLHKLRPDDVDIVVLVSRAEFNKLTKQFVDVALDGGNTGLAKTIGKEAAKGKIPYNRFGPRDPGFSFGQVVRKAANGRKVQVSLVPRGGDFDIGPYMLL